MPPRLASNDLIKNMDEIALIRIELLAVKQICEKLLDILPNFEITDSKILPYGLKPHTRSVSWLVEQVIVQQAKFNADTLGLESVDFNVPDTCLHDCIIDKGGIRYYVNIKTHKSSAKKNTNDIAAVEKLYLQYQVKEDYRLIYACFGIEFQNTNISFAKNSLHIFSPQFLPIYINPRNDKIQSPYHHDVVHRTRNEFLSLLKTHSKSIILQ
jgi:hypothetical protein